MLDIYAVSLQVCRDCLPLIKRIALRDRNLADQLRRALTSIPLNLAEGDGQTGGNRRQRRLTALGSAREVSACLDVALALDYLDEVSADTRGRQDHVIGALVRLAR